MRRATIRSAVFLLCLPILLLAAAGCDDEEHIGGCDTETITSGLAISNPLIPDGIATLMLYSVGEVPLGVVGDALTDLDALLGDLGISVWTRSELRHHRGPCWPPYFLSTVIDTLPGCGEALRQALLADGIAGREGREGTAARFGVFFLELQQENEPCWTIYFHDLPETGGTATL